MVGDGGAKPRIGVRERVGSIRVRTTAAAVLVVGVSLILAGVAMLSLLQRSLRDNVRDNALLRAKGIAREVATGTGPDQLALGSPDEDEEYVQILDVDGRVVVSSPNVSDRAPVVMLAPRESRTFGPLSPPDVEPFDDPFFAVAISSAGSGGPLIVIVGRSLEPVTEASGALTVPLAVALPALLVVVGAVTWWVVVRALSPVDAIRAEVETISNKELHRRVPDPPRKDEIARLAATMNRMLARLEAGQLRERRFVSDASHELRSPVASIRQHAEVAMSHPEETDTREFAQVVLEEDARLQRLVEDLLLLTRLDEGTLHLREEPVDLDDLVFEEAARLRGATDLKIDVGSVSAGRVLGDRQQLGRLIRNLTDNAARHASTTIALSLGEQNGAVVLGVQDDGSGIDQAERDRIFDRFVRLEDARDRDSGGSGLGLAIVREVAAFHGGRVVITRGRLGGAGFEVHLPAHTD
jgi:signal transduction histidine kinase